MKAFKGITLDSVRAVYGGPERALWELLMGEQVHIGGFASSMALAEKAGIGAGQRGIDLCCCTGAGMRFLVRFRGVKAMQGVDATRAVVQLGRERSRREGLSDRIRFTLADACRSGLPGARADFVWGEDAWCYVEDKPRLIAEAARLVKRGGLIAFTDWVEGAKPMTSREAARYLAFMKFPNVLTIREYTRLLTGNRCEILVAEDTKQFAPHVELYLDMVGKQLTYDALRIIGFDTAMLQAIGAEMTFMRGLARAGKIAQARIVARRKKE